MPFIDVRTAQVNSGFQLSGVFELRGGDLTGIWAPVLTSCTIVVRASFDTASANFVNLTNPAGSGDWVFAAGPGSRGITLQDVAFPYPFFKLFCSVVQTDNRIFAAITKPR